MDGSLPFAPVARERGFVAATWGEVLVVGVYASPNKGLADLERVLDGAGEVIRRFCPVRYWLLGIPTSNQWREVPR